MESPVDLSPGEVHLVGPSFSQCMLTEEEHETGAILVHRATMPLDKSHTLNNIGKLDLFVARELWNTNLNQLLVDCHCRLLSEDITVVVFVTVISIQIRACRLIDSLGMSLLSTNVSVLQIITFHDHITNLGCVELAQIHAQVVIQCLSVKVILQNLVHGHQDAPHKCGLARQDALTEELGVEYWQWTIESLNHLEQIQCAILAWWQTKVRSERLRDTNTPILYKHLVSSTNDQEAVAQPS